MCSKARARLSCVPSALPTFLVSVQPSLEQVRPWWVLEGEHASPGLICTRDAANSGESLWLGKVSVEEDGTEGVVVSVRLWHLGKGIAGEERPFTAKAEELAERSRKRGCQPGFLGRQGRAVRHCGLAQISARSL